VSTSRPVVGLAAASGVVFSFPLSPSSDFVADFDAGPFDADDSPFWQPAVIAKARQTAAIAAPCGENLFERIAKNRVIAWFSS
jgi:hypothetical protein